MKATVLALFLSISALAYAQESRVEEVGNSNVSMKFEPGGEIRVRPCPSGVTIRGTDAAEIRVNYHSRDQRTDSVRVRIRTIGRRASVSVADCPHSNFELVIEIPKNSELNVRMMAGDLGITGIAGPKDVELHFGELRMEVGRVEDYGSVDASVTTGELAASAFHVEKGGLFRSFHRNGPGSYRLHAHVGAGELELR